MAAFIIQWHGQAVVAEIQPIKLKYPVSSSSQNRLTTLAQVYREGLEAALSCELRPRAAAHP